MVSGARDVTCEHRAKACTHNAATASNRTGQKDDEDDVPELARRAVARSQTRVHEVREAVNALPEALERARRNPARDATKPIGLPSS